MSVDARGAHFAANSLHVERPVDELDLIEAHGAGDGQGVFHAGRIVPVFIAEGEVMVAIFSADGDVILARF